MTCAQISEVYIRFCPNSDLKNQDLQGVGECVVGGWPCPNLLLHESVFRECQVCAPGVSGSYLLPLCIFFSQGAYPAAEPCTGFTGYDATEL